MISYITLDDFVVSSAARALRARAANDTTRAQINNIPSKIHVIPLLLLLLLLLLLFQRSVVKP